MAIDLNEPLDLSSAEAEGFLTMASAALNLSEGRRRSGRDRRHHYRVGAGSADEVVTCLRVAAALDYISLPSVEEPLEYLDHALAILWKLTH